MVPKVAGPESLTFMSPPPVFAVKFCVFILSAVVAVPKLPDVLLLPSVIEPPDACAVIVPPPAILPAAVIKVTELVDEPPSEPISVMPPEPLLVSIEIVEALPIDGMIVTAVADCKENACRGFAAVNLRILPLSPKLLMKILPLELAASELVETLSAVVALPMALPVSFPVLSVRVGARMESVPPGTASVIVPLPVAVRVTEPEILIV
jgi:hypothetical protein